MAVGVVEWVGGGGRKGTGNKMCQCIIWVSANGGERDNPIDA